MLSILFFSIFSISFFTLYFFLKNKRSNTPIKEGDIAVLKFKFIKAYESIPHNNVLHVLEVDSNTVKVEYISFKDGSYHQQLVSKDVLRKIRKSAA